jgi:hypothetical protein
MFLHTASLLACILLGGLLVTPSATAQDRFVQDRFAIGFWVDPPIDANAAAHYRDIADASFTVVIGGFGGTTPDTVSEQLELCERFGLRAVVSRAGLSADRLPESAACWGYMLRDEPPAGDFASLRAVVDEIRAARPGRLAYINILPNYANAQQLGTPTYDEHVRRFVDEVDVDVLSMDHYPMMQPGADSRQSYCDNLEAMRKHSLRRGIPYWNFFNSMPYGPHYDPSEHSLRWQIYTTLAYGARGILYFCYWTPRGDEFPKGGAIITAEGRKTRHYEQAKRLNAVVKALGPTLMKLTSEEVVRVAPGVDATTALTGTPVTALDYGAHGDFLVGVFRHADGRRAVLLNNYDFLYTSWPTVTFDVDPSEVMEVSQETGLEAPVLDDSPDMPGLQLSLDAGGGRLFLLPAK